MQRFWRALSPSDWLVVLAGLALVGWIEVTKTPAPEPPPRAGAPAEDPGMPALYGPESWMMSRQDARLDGPMQARLEAEFAGGAYFGAFAVGQAGAYGWVAGYGTPAAARQAAVESCARHGGDCRVVAELWPAGVKDPPDHSLNHAQRQALDRIGGLSLGIRAFAASPDGRSGTARGEALEQVIEAALAACNSSPSRALTPLPCGFVIYWDEALLPR